MFIYIFLHLWVLYKVFCVFFLRSGDELKNGSSNSSSNITNGENGASNGVNSITAQLRRQHMADIVFGDNTEKSAAVGNPSGGARILSFKSKAPAADEGHMNNLKVLEYETATLVMCLNTFPPITYRSYTPLASQKLRLPPTPGRSLRSLRRFWMLLT